MDGTHPRNFINLVLAEHCRIVEDNDVVWMRHLRWYWTAPYGDPMGRLLCLENDNMGQIFTGRNEVPGHACNRRSTGEGGWK